ncbi:unnamed protein product [Protopolystoma xenopodis]|uniref:Ubiquitin-like domain-containing protein n=1 Tax=Protopolystoma xenopodis TaxID=117903 RepID=A0A448WH34_9PLAT|nr:unnamed protein product [Protopolystoma xenopodis]
MRNTILFIIHFATQDMTRLFVTYKGERTAIDVLGGMTVDNVKQLIRHQFSINENRAQLGDENQERPSLVIEWAGAQLQDNWLLEELCLPTGTTIKARLKEEIDPLLHIDVSANQEF